MADIGSLLRETRIRNKIDITTVEDATKIRAKYLRALENEEWGLLPGPTYVKTFLRTYAQFLGLDPHLLVEEYSARFEEPEELEVAAFTPKRRLPDRARPRRGRPPRRGYGVALVLAAFLAFLLVLGLTGGDDEPDSGQTSTTATQREGREGQTPAAAERSREKREQAKPARRNVRLQVVATRPVWVCLVDDKDTERVAGVVMQGGDREGPFRSRSFRVTFGNGGGDLRIDGRRRDTPDRAEPIGYRVRPSGVTVLSEEKRPTCG
jgi:cytoskeleton protein RodZ